MHFSKLVSCKPFLKANHKINSYTNTKHTHQIFKRQVSSILPLLKKYKARTSWNHLTILIFGYQTMEISTILQFIFVNHLFKQSALFHSNFHSVNLIYKTHQDYGFANILNEKNCTVKTKIWQELLPHWVYNSCTLYKLCTELFTLVFNKKHGQNS